MQAPIMRVYVCGWECDQACTGKHLCREKQWEMMLQVRSQEKLSPWNISTRPIARTQKHAGAENGGAQTRRHPQNTGAALSFITRDKSPIF